MDCSPPGSPEHGILRQEYWNGLPFPSPGDLPHPGSNPGLLHWQANSLLSEPPGKALWHCTVFVCVTLSTLSFRRTLLLKGYLRVKAHTELMYHSGRETEILVYSVLNSLVRAHFKIQFSRGSCLTQREHYEEDPTHASWRMTFKTNLISCGEKGALHSVGGDASQCPTVEKSMEGS